MFLGAGKIGENSPFEKFHYSGKEETRTGARNMHRVDKGLPENSITRIKIMTIQGIALILGTDGHTALLTHNRRTLFTCLRYKFNFTTQMKSKGEQTTSIAVVMGGQITCWGCNRKGHMKAQCPYRIIETVVSSSLYSLFLPLSLPCLARGCLAIFALSLALASLGVLPSHTFPLNLFADCLCRALILLYLSLFLSLSFSFSRMCRRLRLQLQRLQRLKRWRSAYFFLYFSLKMHMYMYIYTYTSICSEDCFYYCSERNNVVVLFGTLKVHIHIVYMYTMIYVYI